MKTAIMFSGQARTFASCYRLMYWKVLRNFENPTIFVSVADDDQAPTMQALTSLFEDVRIEYVDQPEFPEAKDYLARSAPCGYGLANHVVQNPANVMKAFWHYKRVWQMIEKPEEYDVFVRIRPDLWFLEYEHGLPTHSGMCRTPLWGRFGGVNDRFSVMGMDAAKAYMTAIDRVPELLMSGCPYHPETLTRAAVESSGCYVSFSLETMFLFRRMASVFHPKENPACNKEWLVAEPDAAFWHMQWAR